jgi:3-oxoacyl-[acyl-carrier-protein] synthase II
MPTNLRAMLPQPVELIIEYANVPDGGLKEVCRAFSTPVPERATQDSLEKAGVSLPINKARYRAFFATTKGWAADDDPVKPFGLEMANAGMTVVSNACVSGAQAVIEAAESLIDGDWDLVAVNAGDYISKFVRAGFGSLQASASSVARPFDRRRDGLTLGTADASVYLRRAGTRSHLPRIISYGCSNDANHISGPSRDGAGLALAIERALVDIDRREIRAICAHGTATQYNDAMEARAFHTVFGGSPPPVFGIKGAIGHTLGAAGLIEVIISAKVATEGVIPPTTGYEHGETDFPLDVVHGKPRKIKPGLVLTTNSGFGGMNTAIIVGPGNA